MKLYKVKANDYDYDEYDSFVVWAENEEQALNIVKEKTKHVIFDRTCGNFLWGATVYELTAPSEPGIVIGSFNAG